MPINVQNDNKLVINERALKNDLTRLRKLKAPEITASMLMDAFSDYVDIRGKINSLKKKGLIHPIKQGVYLISGDLGWRPYSQEILAQLIYGPSYISLETALSNYGFIPERANVTTSICMGRGKVFSTPVGDFVFHHIKEEIYPIGIQLREIFDGAFCLYASPEKALLDLIYIKETKGEFKNQKEYFEFILDSYRMDITIIAEKVSLKNLSAISEVYPFKHVQWFASELMKRILR